MSIVDGSSVVQESLPGRNVFDLTLVNCHSGSYPLPLKHRNIQAEEIRLVGPMFKIKTQLLWCLPAREAAEGRINGRVTEPFPALWVFVEQNDRDVRRQRPRQEAMGQNYQNRPHTLAVINS